MTSTAPSPTHPGGTGRAWAVRTAERSPAVQRTRARSVEQAAQIVDAARRILINQGGQFTIHELVKEAGVALRTFYRYFAGKDELLLALLEEMIADAAEQLWAAGASIADPVERLRFYVTEPLHGMFNDSGGRVITAEHWRLHQLHPKEVAQATQHFTDLIGGAIEAAAAAGELRPLDPERDAWTITAMVMAIYHHYVFADPGADLDAVRDHLWHFCLLALGGEPPAAGPARGRRVPRAKGTRWSTV